MLTDRSWRPQPPARLATLDEVLGLRALVLRDGAPRDTARYPADDDALHVVVADPLVVACATGQPEPLDGEPAWRVRGVAVHPQRQGTGAGRLVVEAALGLAPAATWWCTARVAKVGFWERMGFAVVTTEPLLLPYGGLHHRMRRPAR